jgi:hypothetical protein
MTSENRLAVNACACVQATTFRLKFVETAMKMCRLRSRNSHEPARRLCALKRVEVGPVPHQHKLDRMT